MTSSYREGRFPFEPSAQPQQATAFGARGEVPLYFQEEFNNFSIPLPGSLPGAFTLGKSKLTPQWRQWDPFNVFPLGAVPFLVDNQRKGGAGFAPPREAGGLAWAMATARLDSSRVAPAPGTEYEAHFYTRISIMQRVPAPAAGEPESYAGITLATVDMQGAPKPFVSVALKTVDNTGYEVCATRWTDPATVAVEFEQTMPGGVECLYLRMRYKVVDNGDDTFTTRVFCDYSVMGFGWTQITDTELELDGQPVSIGFGCSGNNAGEGGVIIGSCFCAFLRVVPEVQTIASVTTGGTLSP